MRKLSTLFVFIISCYYLKAQTVFITEQNYQNLKQSGTLDSKVNYKFINSSNNRNNVNYSKIVDSETKLSGAKTMSNSACQCLLPIDSTFSLVPMSGYTTPYRNDDGSSDSIEYKLNFLWKSVSKYKIDFLYTYWYCHSTSHGISQDNYILGNRFLIKSKIPVEHLVSYVNNFVDNIFDVYKNLRDNINIQKDKKYHHKFFYGIDEIYLELIVIMYIKKNKIKYGRYVSYHFISLDELLKSLFRKVDENNSSFIKIINSINKKYNTNYKNINDFFDFFKDYDWYRKTNMYKQYEFFHKKAIKLYDKEPTLEKSKRFDSCFRKIPKFLDKTNIIEIFN